MHLKTAAGTYAPLLAIGIAAVVGGCATQEDAQPPQFSQPPFIEAVYARDTVGGDLADVQIWANPADAHYPNLIGETGAQNAQDVSPFPASYGGIVVEFDTTIDPSKWLPAGTTIDVNLGSYCSTGSSEAGSDPTKAPFTVVDLDNNSQPLAGSICYDPTSPLYRYPNLVFVVGNGVDTDPSANPFTCQSFSPTTGDANGAAFIPSQHHYGIQFNTAVIANDNGQALVTPTPASGTAWPQAAQFEFVTSGFDIMAAGYQNQDDGYFTFIDKPYAGYLKDLACPGPSQIPNGSCPAPAGAYLQPSDNTPFYIYTTLDVGDETPITATRADGSSFGATVSLLEPRVIEVTPGLTWEPGQQYVVTVGSDLTTADPANPLTISASATYSFSAAPADLATINVAPADGATAQLAYGKQGAAIDQPSFVLIDYNVPVDPNAIATPGNVTVTGPDGTSVPGTVSFTVGLNDQEILFAPTNAFASSTVYTVNATNIDPDPSIANSTIPAGSKFPDFTSQFTTSNMRTSAFISVDTGASADRASDQPLSILADGVEILFARPVDTSTVLVDPTTPGPTPTNITITEIGADGTPGTAIDPSNIGFFEEPLAQGAAPSPFFWVLGVAYGQPVTSSTPQSYPVKCNQEYYVTFGTAITDSDETPEAHLSAEGCKTGNCPDVRSFTTIPYTVVDGQVDYTPASGNIPDTLSVTFNASLDHNIANPLIDAGLIKLVDSSGNNVPLTCPDLVDDTSTTITCTVTNGPLAANTAYKATMIVDSNSPLEVATQADGIVYQEDGNACNTLADCPSTDAVCDVNGICAANEPILADPTTCNYSGAILTPILTGCSQTTARGPAKKSANKLGTKLAQR